MSLWEKTLLFYSSPWDLHTAADRVNDVYTLRFLKLKQKHLLKGILVNRILGKCVWQYLTLLETLWLKRHAYEIWWKTLIKYASPLFRSYNEDLLGESEMMLPAERITCLPWKSSNSAKTRNTEADMPAIPSLETLGQNSTQWESEMNP